MEDKLFTLVDGDTVQHGLSRIEIGLWFNHNLGEIDPPSKINRFMKLLSTLDYDEGATYSRTYAISVFREGWPER